MLFLLACLPDFPQGNFPEDPLHDFDQDGYTIDDCNDIRADAYPGADEVCDGIDNDCDGSIDEDAIDASVWYADKDLDGYGVELYPFSACIGLEPDNYAPLRLDTEGNPVFDCDDDPVNGYGAAVFPGALETCTPFDDNCNGFINEADETIADIPQWYLDRDLDGYGGMDPNDVIERCEAPSPDYRLLTGDCDDVNAEIYPTAVERCDEIDNDCDELIDEDDDNVIIDAIWYIDADLDGFGSNSPDAETLVQCSQPIGYVLQNNDCDDSSNAISPIGVEVCDEIDNDCDGTVDDGVQQIFFLDVDGDGYGRYFDLDGDGIADDNDGDGLPDNLLESCTAPIDPVTGNLYVETYTDCDDNNPYVNPAGIEECDGIDNNCNGLIDGTDAVTAPVWFKDADNDGYGDPYRFVQNCSQPPTYVSDSTDCDDARTTVNPSAVENCTTVFDDDCDNITNNIGALGCVDYYEDYDGDGYGSINGYCLCYPDSSNAFTSTVNIDCDDSNPLINPNQIENCVTPFDDNCNNDVNDYGAIGCINYYYDNDGDGYGLTTDKICACEQEGLYSATAGNDCLDSDSYINPGMQEICDGLDNNCDGILDQGDAIDATAWYVDSDGDGYGNPNVVTLNNGSTSPFLQCYAPSGFVTQTLALDCDDQVTNVNPSLEETCYTSYDDDCDGSINSENAPGCINYYEDLDGDGYGTSNSICTCEPTVAYSVLVDGDCDDLDSAVSLDAVEVCDGGLTDENCDGFFDDQDAAGCTFYFEDFDGDTYGQGIPMCLCSPQGLYTATEAGDCDDNNQFVSHALGNCYLVGDVAYSTAGNMLSADSSIVQQDAIDVNADGVLDLVLAAPYESSAGTNVGALFVFYSPLPSNLQIGTLGNADIIIAPDTLADYSGEEFGVSFVAGNFDGDSNAVAELIVASGSGKYIFSNLLTGGVVQWNPSEMQAVPIGSAVADERFIFVGDVDGDGFDNAVLLGSGAHELWDGNINAASTGLIFEGSLPDGVRKADHFWDFNADGIQDIVISDGSQNGIIYGGVGLSGSVDIAINSMVNIRGVQDYDGDGYHDVVGWDPSYEEVVTEAGLGSFTASNLGKVEILLSSGSCSSPTLLDQSSCEGSGTCSDAVYAVQLDCENAGELWTAGTWSFGTTVTSFVDIIGEYHAGNTLSTTYSLFQHGFAQQVYSVGNIDGDANDGGDIVVLNGVSEDYFGNVDCRSGLSIFLSGFSAGTYQVSDMDGYGTNDLFAGAACDVLTSMVQPMGDINADSVDDFFVGHGMTNLGIDSWQDGVLFSGALVP